MTGFLLDTNVPSELSRRHPEPKVEAWLEAADRNAAHISVISLGEIRKGIALLRDPRRRRELDAWFANDVSTWFAGRILPVTQSVSERWGLIDADRQSRGRPLNTADGLIAATAMEHGLSLVTRNVRDFEGLKLKIINPWES